MIQILGVNPTDLMILREIDEHISEHAGRQTFTAKQLKRCRKFCEGLERIASPYSDIREAEVLQKKHHEIRHNGRCLTLDGGEAQLFAANAADAGF